jgi:D-glycero-D-manno-heptose 1,7-bisphosphate phosphatase
MPLSDAAAPAAMPDACPARDFERPRQAVVLVGGKGTRLGALAAQIPKPLMPIDGDVRFLDYLLESLGRCAFDDIVLLAGHLGKDVARRYAGAHVGPARVEVWCEPSPAGTAGALCYAADRLGECFLMTNGDSLFEMDYLALAGCLGPSDVGALALRRVEDAARYGSVACEGGRIVGFREKDPQAGAGLISGGVYVLRRSVLDYIDRQPCSMESDVFPKLAACGRLAGRAFEGFFLDIGLPETLEEARRVIPGRMGALRAPRIANSE